MAPLVIVASSKPNCNQTWDRIQKRLDDRRTVLENTRSMSVKRIQQDIEKITKREVEFAQKILEEIIPVKVIVNEDALAKLQSFVPVRFELKEKVQSESNNTSNTSNTNVANTAINGSVASVSGDQIDQ